MKVSVIVPVYNVEEFVLGCLESINNQSFKDYEVIVVNDCSTDGSLQIVKEYVGVHPHFQLIDLPQNGGVMHAWMEGVKHASGDYLFFVDSDDTVPEDALDTLVNIVHKYDVDIACGNSSYDTRRYGGGLSYHDNYIKAGLYAGEKVKEIQKAVFPTIKQHYFSPARWAKLFKKDLLVENLKYCDTSITSGDDVNIVLPCMMSAKSVYFIDKPVYYYLQRPNSISRAFNNKILGTYDTLISKIAEAVADKHAGYLQEELNSLYSYYAISWCIYVVNSNLSSKDKKKEINRLFDKQYQFVKVSMKDLCSNWLVNLYVLTVMFKSPSLFLKGWNGKKKIKKLLKR
ncbi:MAG: glycosyltransferase family 2 protein [Bacteroidales bacterium]|nr:glycosyltransferase family 2 protein [Bacteroidales bacterium]